MATFPDYVTIQFQGYGEEFDPSVQRDEMERGPARETIINYRVIENIKATLVFNSKADIQSFLDWYHNDIKRIGWFDIAHPRTGQIVQAKFVGGDIGTLTPFSPDFSSSYRQTVLEFMQ